MTRTYQQMMTTRYSIFPAMIVVQEMGEGRQLLSPIPLTGPILWRWLWILVVGMLPLPWQAGSRCDRSVPFVCRLLEVRWLMTTLVETVQQTQLSLQLGTILARSLAWGVLGL